MPAPLVPHASIPDLTKQVTPKQREVLAAIQRAGFIRNQGLDEQTATALGALTQLGLVDPACDGRTNGPIDLWTSNGNGQRVLRYLTGIRSEPHYEVAAEELAAWLEGKGNDRWWTVDGDPVLTGRLDIPCPADELAAELRRIGQPLLVQAKKEDVGAKGQMIDRSNLDAVAGKLADNLQLVQEGPMPPWSGDRLLYLCWKGSTTDWLLAEDSNVSRQMQASDEGKAVETVDVTKE